MNIFNEYGKPNDDVEQFEGDISNQIDKFLKKLRKGGCMPIGFVKGEFVVYVPKMKEGKKK
jgi:hypothetical protein